jgi:hypothetical protein
VALARHNRHNKNNFVSAYMPPPEKSVLIVTVPPVLGGITNQSRLTADLLAGRGYAPTLAWRAYYGEYP